MDIRAEPERGHGKGISMRIAEHIGADPGRFAVLMHCLAGDTPRIMQRAAWPMGIACEAHPGPAAPWISRMLDLLNGPAHEAVHRNIMRTLQFCALPTKYHGRLTEQMFAWIADPRRPIAPRTSAITVALRLVKAHPDLSSELRLLLEHVPCSGPGPAIRSRATTTLNGLAQWQQAR